MTRLTPGTALAICALATAGFALTVAVFYPGYMTNDAVFLYRDMKAWQLGDWQSPMMIVLWRLIDPIAPGPASMFLLIATLYWLAFATIALTLARQVTWLGLLVPLLGLLPPAFVFLGMIWRDMVLAATWLLACAIVYAAAAAGSRWRAPMTVVALALVVFGTLLRPSAIVTAPLLMTYVLSPQRFSWKRAAIVFLPALVVAFALLQIVYYGILDVRRQNPLHQIFVFDLGGITHFTGQNQFPVVWTAEQTELLTSRCYDPDRWDSYWTIEPCRFVMTRLEDPNETIFGTTLLRTTWMQAIASHPLAYLTHRASYLWNLLGRETMTLELYFLDTPGFTPLAQNQRFRTVLALHDRLKSTLLFRLGLWVALAAAVCAFATRARATPTGAFATAVTASAVIYVLTYAAVGVAGDFRYGYWCVLATLAGGAAALATPGPRAA